MRMEDTNALVPDVDPDMFGGPDSGFEGFDDNQLDNNPGGALPTGSPESENVSAFRTNDDGTFRFGDRQLSADELTEALTAGLDVSERNKAATVKFQEAADMRRGVDDALAEYGQLRTVAQAMAALPEGAQAEIFRQIEGYVSGLQNGSPPAPANLPFRMPSGFKPEAIPSWDELSDEGQAIVAAFAPMMNELGQLRAQVNGVAAVMPDVSTFVKEARVNTQLSDAQQLIKTEYQVDVSPADLQNAMRATGIQNPSAAWVFQNRQAIAQSAATRAATVAGQKPLETPSGGGKFFDPSGMTADQIARNLGAGMQMKRG